MRQYYLIYDDETSKVSETGGKGFSLMRMAGGGLPVPGGFILTSDFFREWYEELKGSNLWEDLNGLSSEQLIEKAGELKKRGLEFSLNSSQKKTVDEAFEKIEDGAGPELFAVRSSSPEEDMDGSSFAGGYESFLGVKREETEKRIVEIFASSLSSRVMIYKKEHGFDLNSPSIAVVVQRQIPAEAAGVGFSVNPLNNCYDEAVINSNFGLGETVVSGEVSPDRFVVDKYSLEILEKNRGGGEKSLWLAGSGEIIEREGFGSDRFSISDEQAVEITELVKKVEKYYEKPIDTEWALFKNKLYLLQARPVTTYLPLPPEIMTEPGEKRKMYIDVTLTVQGIHEPLSIMATDWLNHLFGKLSIQFFGGRFVDCVRDGLLAAAGGRIYANVSHLVKILGRERTALIFKGMDTISSELIEKLDDRYVPDELPENLAGLDFKAVFSMPDAAARVLKAAILPDELIDEYFKGISSLVRLMQRLSKRRQPLEKVNDIILRKAAKVFVHVMLPTFASANMAKNRIRELFADDTPEIRKLVELLDRSLPGNITVDMGLTLFRTSKLLRGEDLTIDKLVEGIRKRSLSEDFLTEWDDFLDRFGFRGPREIDLASLRYRDKPEMILRQMLKLSQLDDEDENPYSVYMKSRKKRRNAYKKLSRKVFDKGWIRSSEFQMLYGIIEKFGGLRENHKYNLVKINYLIREKVLEKAESLVEAGRLDSVEQVFGLLLEDLAESTVDENLDLRKRIRERRAFYDKIKERNDFPHLIDSRGAIPSLPKKETGEDELAGRPISAGVVRGTVKVFHNPDEKEINRGDVLVARATDPGWTPLFVNASAIVLEVGGMLQHGSLVAREYGKPCVAGVENVTEVLKDGQMIEVDGSAGIIRIIREEKD